MVERFTRTILSFLIVLSAYWLYALVVVPSIDPDQSHLDGAATLSVDLSEKPTDRFRPLLERLFPTESWELDRAMVLKNDQFMLVVSGHETLNEGLQLKLKKCTVVLNPEAAQTGGTPEKGSCIILTATDGAILDFDRPFALANKALGKLLGGRLVGDVSIRSHTGGNVSGQPATNLVEIDTRNVQINSQQIWTPHEVRFRYGQNYGAGRDLIINLTEVETGDFRRLPAENPTYLRSLELVHLDRLTVTASTESSLTDASPTNPTTLRIRCQGPLLFDFVGGSVTLRDNVAIQRTSGVVGLDDQQSSLLNRGSPEGQSDWLTCDLLAMQFRAPRGDDPSLPNFDASSNRPQPKWELPNFDLAQITAFGSPAVVDAPSYKVLAQAERIELNLALNRLLLQDTEEAILRYNTHTFRAPQMRYFVDPQGGPGRAEVNGSGQYIGAFEEDSVQLRWRNGLKFGPRDGKYLLEVDGDAQIQWGRHPAAITAVKSPATTTSAAPLQLPAGQTIPNHHPLPNQLSAGQLQVWLRQQQPLERTGLRPVSYGENEPSFPVNPPHSSHLPAESTVANPNANEPTSDSRLPFKRSSSGLAGLADSWRPERVTARTKVQLRTPQLIGDVEYAEVELRAGRDSIADRGVEDSMTGPALISPRGAHPTPVTPTEQYQLTGHEVRVALQSSIDGESHWFESIKIQGGVHLRQVTPKTGGAEIEINGTLVELNQSPAAAGVIGRVAGEPATVKTQGVELTGRAIQVDQTQNLVWIDGAGSAYIPLPERIAIQFSRRTATMQVSWLGGMNFDGESVTCEKGVEIRGPAQIATADALQATLVQPIRLGSLENRQRPTGGSIGPLRESEQVLSEISLTGKVWLENRSFDDLGLASIDEFRLHSLTYNQSTGQLVGDGPGWISSLRYTQQRATPIAGIPRTNDAPRQAAQLTHTVIEFQKQLNGSLAKREVSVHDRVRAIHGPISDWQQRIRFDDPERSPETIVMRAMRLTVAQMPSGGGQPSLEFAASGNTEIEGRTFMARAQHVRYAQAKDMLVMEGDGRSVVQLSYQSRIGAPRNTAAARKIQYWIHENRFKGDGFIFGDMTGPIANQPERPLPTQKNATGGQNPLQQPVLGRFSQPGGAGGYAQPRN